MQLDLGLRKIDKTRTRQMVREYFRLYRYRKRLLEADLEERPAERRPLPGYEHAADPRTIRAPGYDGSRIPHLPPDIDEDPRDRERRRFCREVERAVDALPEYQAAIIRKLYMEHEPSPLHPAPTDLQVWRELYGDGWYVSERYYESQKAQAIFRLAETWGITQYVE
ncbi:hypothetical protein [Alicyclobacillus macrosporangiidus]|uniref:Phage transcriptional regulator, ArpU family n=1 Tax=Alicyclobacillus macrosporangiidus TaxID=392015 RepID=A0A1I7ID87_9BACL|nr:hypothetical protein [Alicyclobacillus macrosporangiidus]SFU70810.1 hypothetical protein SAMN05421543_106145 [Alicyclobacillus macrosporangiidus]